MCENGEVIRETDTVMNSTQAAVWLSFSVMQKTSPGEFDLWTVQNKLYGYFD